MSKHSAAVLAARGPEHPLDLPRRDFQAARARERLGGLLRGQRVVLVGPSASIVGGGHGPLIDSYDLVVRMNFQWPVPRELQPDVGSRMDILYHCCNGDHPVEVLSTQNFGASRFVCYESNPHVAALTELCNRHGIPTMDVTDEYVRLHESLGTFPNTGTVAIHHLLGFELSELYVTGISFFHDPYYAGYLGDGAASSGWEGKPPPRRIWRHDFPPQLDYFRGLHQRDPRLTIDARLAEIVAHGRWE